MLTINNSVNFRGVPVAKVKPLAKYGADEITLFKLSQNDEKYLQKMVRNINLKKLLPDSTSKVKYDKWKKMITNAVSKVGQPGRVILAVQNKRPCGIMAFRDENTSTSYLGFIATWPTKPNQKSKFAGQALIRELFQYNVDTNRTSLELMDANDYINGKRCTEFYKKLGFEDSPIYMDILELKDVNFQQKNAQLENFFEYKKIKNSEDVNLSKILRPNIETPIQKIINFFKL